METEGTDRPAVMREAAVSPPSPRPRQGLAGARGGIMRAYLDALEAQERATGIRMEANQTVREFLRAVTARAVSGRGPFTDLTLMAEVALYSAREPDEEMAATAERLATAVAEEVQRDAA